MTLSTTRSGTPGTASAYRLGRWFNTLVRILMRVVEAVAAALMVAETLILLAVVAARYVLDNPLTWSDELASILFSWLAMLGAVIALDRGEHMRLTALVNRLPERWRGWFETLGALVVCVFVALVIMPAVQHASGQMDITTPALEIPDGLRCMSLVVGTILM